MMNSFGPRDRLLVAIAGDVPHHHLVALADRLAADLAIGQRGAPHVHHRRLPADDLRHQARDQAGVVAQLAILVGIVVQRPHAARDRIARRLVAADDQQRQVAQELLRPVDQVARRLAMRQHRDQIGPRFGRGALAPEFGEALQRLGQDLQPLRLGIDDGAGVHIGDRAIRPVDQLVAIREREVHQRRQHLDGQLDRHVLHPVERLVARQRIEDVPRALADRRRQLVQVHRRHDRRDHLALLVVLRRVHRDEAGAAIFHRPVGDRDAAQHRLGRIGVVVRLDRHDVLVLGHRPVRAVHAVLRVVHRVLAAQALEIRIPGVVLVELRVADVDLHRAAANMRPRSGSKFTGAFMLGRLLLAGHSRRFGNVAHLAARLKVPGSVQCGARPATRSIRASSTPDVTNAI